MRAAADEIRALIAAAGEPASPATMIAVNETLQALPSAAAADGRLTKPLKPGGFEALAGLVPSGERTLRALAPAPPPASAKDEPPNAVALTREANARKRDDAARRAALREAQQDVRTATAALADARKTLARAKADRDRLQDQLQFVVKTIDDASSAVREREAALARATQEQERLSSPPAS